MLIVDRRWLFWNRLFFAVVLFGFTSWLVWADLYLFHTQREVTLKRGRKFVVLTSSDCAGADRGTKKTKSKKWGLFQYNPSKSWMNHEKVIIFRLSVTRETLNFHKNT